MDARNQARDAFEPLAECPVLLARVVFVVDSLPDDVQRDLLHDPRFRFSIDNFAPGKGSTVWVAPLAADGSSRSVVLRRRLAECDEAFAHYVIAHELAHAYLHNRGWGEITDPEEAADALAASWGYPKLRRRWWG